jgi:hypothetical protein
MGENAIATIDDRKQFTSSKKAISVCVANSKGQRNGIIIRLHGEKLRSFALCVIQGCITKVSLQGQSK